MIRLVVVLLVSILLITILRSVIGLILRTMAEMMGPADGTAERGRKRAAGVPLSGELRRDPVCGTFVPMTTALQKSHRGEVLYFCSVACRDRHGAGS